MEDRASDRSLDLSNLSGPPSDFTSFSDLPLGSGLSLSLSQSFSFSLSNSWVEKEKKGKGNKKEGRRKKNRVLKE
jgi:hypothetical protein